MTRVPIDDILPVTPSCGDGCAAVQYVVDLQGVPQEDRLESALRRLARRHPILRSVFLFNRVKRPVQVVLKHAAVNLVVQDFSTIPAGGTEGAVDEWLRRHRESGISAERGPIFNLALLKLGDGNCKLVWTFHSLAVDDWSFGLLRHDFWNFYTNRHSNTRLENVGLRFLRNYLHFLQQQDKDDARRFWRRYLLNPPQAPKLPGQLEHTSTKDPVWKRFSVKVPLPPSSPVISRSFVFGVWGALLQTYSGTEDVLFDGGIQGRSSFIRELSRIAGNFSFSTPLRVNALEDTPFADVTAQLDDHLRQCRRFGHFPSEGMEKIVPVPFLITVMEEPSRLSPPVSLPNEFVVASLEKWAIPQGRILELHCALNGTVSLEVTVSYQSSLFEDGAVERIADDFSCLLRWAVQHPDHTVGNLTGAIRESRGQGLLSELKERVLANVPAYMVPSRFMVLDKLPLGPSGKVDRRRLPDPALGDTGGAERPLQGDTERKLREIWADVLSVPPNEIRRESDFFNLGGHSLRAVRLANAISALFGVTLEIRTIFSKSTLEAMANEIDSQAPAAIASIPQLEPRPFYELSYAQQRIWILSRLQPDSSAFNMPVEVPVIGRPMRPEAVERVLRQLIRRHDAMRTYFVERDQEVAQVVGDGSMDIPLEYVDLSSLEEDRRESECRRLVGLESRRPFDLLRPPLFRALMIKMEEERHFLLFNMHHIISDGWSLQVLRREFQTLYNGLESGHEVALSPLRIQYKDYAHWHNRLLEESSFAIEARDSWRRQLDGHIPPLDLPFDFPQNRELVSSGAGFRTYIPHADGERLNALCRDNRASLFMVMLAALNLTLSFLRKQEDIVVGIAGAAREHEDLKNVMGLFVNTLIIRSRIPGDEPFLNYLAEVRETAYQTLQYQGYPLELACEQLGIQYPKLNVFFNMLNLGEGAAAEMTDQGDVHLEETQDNKFPLTFYVSEYSNGIEIFCTYLRELFQPVTIQKIVLQYRDLLSAIGRDPAKPVKDYKTGGKKKTLKRKKER
jgi:acyl carrier protein